MVLYLLTYHGVLCHQARDLFSAGSVANPKNDDAGGIYIERALKLIEKDMREAAAQMDDALFVEYWGESVAPENRIKRWLEKQMNLHKIGYRQGVYSLIKKGKQRISTYQAVSKSSQASQRSR